MSSSARAARSRLYTQSIHYCTRAVRPYVHMVTKIISYLFFGLSGILVITVFLA